MTRSSLKTCVVLSPLVHDSRNETTPVQVAPEYLNQPIGSAMGVARIDSIISAYKDLAAALKTQLDALQNAACDIARVERSGPNPPGSRPLKNLDNDPEAIKRVDRHYRSTLDQLYAHETRIKVLSAIRNNLDADPSNTIVSPCRRP